MVRLLAAFVVLGALVSPISSARALGTMCTEQSFVSFVEEPVDVEVAAPAQPAALPSPMRDEDLPWCASAADPRCSPMRGHGSAPFVGLRQPAAVATALPPSDPASVADFDFTPQLGLLPSAGEGSRVERPPR